MSWYFVQVEESPGHVTRNAGTKAPADVESILSSNGFGRLPLKPVEGRADAGPVGKALGHRRALHSWLDATRLLEPGDGLILQMPFANHTIWFDKVVKSLREKDVRLVLLIHDLESVRLALAGDASYASSKRFRLEEAVALSSSDAIIAHNERMADFISSHFDYPREHLVPLGLFDYLIPEFDESIFERPDDPSTIIAGNLKEDKAGYAYHLPGDVPFNLYGVGYEPNQAPANVRYHGSFPSDELPKELRGRFGLVWDGPRADTCSGVYGKYLRINSPHKASLYLASGFPLIVRDQSALASLVRSEGVGLCVSSLEELHEAIGEVSDAGYGQMIENARRIGSRLRTGGFTMDAVRTAIAIANGR
jgi:hypothetical protein